MKTTKILFASLACATLLFTSCSKSIETPFEVYFISADREFPIETRVIYNSNYIGDVKIIDKEQLPILDELPSGLKTNVNKVTIKTIDNSGKELSNITFSLLPDGSYKKVSSTGEMDYELKTIDKFKFAILYQKP